MQENLPKPQGCLILDDKTFLCPTPPRVSPGLWWTAAHTRTHAHMQAQTGARRPDPEKQTHWRKWRPSKKLVLKGSCWEMSVAKVRLGAHLAKRKKGSCAFISADKNQLWPESSPTTLVTFPLLPLRGPFDVVCVYVLERYSVFPKTSSHGRRARIFTIINNLILDSMAHTNILPCEDMEYLFFFIWSLLILSSTHAIFGCSS